MKLLNRKNKLLIFIIVSISIIYFLNYKISTDIIYHTGKDGGDFKRLESIIVLSILFYVIMSKKIRILYGFIGFVISLLSTILGLFISSGLPDFFSERTILHMFIFGISYLSFFGIEKIIENTFS